MPRPPNINPSNTRHQFWFDGRDDGPEEIWFYSTHFHSGASYVWPEKRLRVHQEGDRELRGMACFDHTGAREMFYADSADS